MNAAKNPMEQIRELTKQWRKDADNTFGFHAGRKCAVEVDAILASTDWVCVPVAELKWLTKCSDSDMRDGDEARDKANQWIAAAPSPGESV